MRVCRSAPAALLGASLAFAVSRPLAAQQPFDISAPTPSPPAPSGTEQAVISRYWELGRPRGFFATTIEAGYAYARPRLALGYGQPYWRWIGLEAWPLVSLSGAGQYVGIGAAVPGLSARIGGRYTYPFSRELLVARNSYERIDMERKEGPRADYLALEAELTATAPLFAGSVFAVLTGYRVELVDSGYYLYEESLRAIMKPPYVYRGRLGYLAGFGRDGAIRLGVAGDFIGLPGRDEYVIRAGIIGSVSITANLEAQASFIPVIVSPDSLGLAGGDFGQLGIRYRWATGSKPDPTRVRALIDRKLKDKANQDRTRWPWQP